MALFRTSNAPVLAAIHKLQEQLTKMSDDFTAAQTALDAAIAKVGADVTALLAKVATLPPDQQAEVTAEVAALGASNAALAAIDTSANPTP